MLSNNTKYILDVDVNTSGRSNTKQLLAYWFVIEILINFILQCIIWP